MIRRRKPVDTRSPHERVDYAIGLHSLGWRTGTAGKFDPNGGVPTKIIAAVCKELGVRSSQRRALAPYIENAVKAQCAAQPAIARAATHADGHGIEDETSIGWSNAANEVLSQKVIELQTRGAEPKER